jgi:hypothetical protein
MVAARAAQGIEDRRGAGRGADAPLRLAVEHPKRVALTPPPAVVAQLGVARREVFRQPRVVGGTALRVAERVDLEGHPAQARPREEPVKERHRLGVGVRSVGAEQLRAHLVELPHPPLLRALVPEHGADVVEADRSLARAGPVVEEGADHRRGPLGAHREALPGPVGEGVHLLLDDVGRLPHGPREELGALQQGGPDLPEAVPPGVGAERRLERGPPFGLGGKDILHPPDGRQCHGTFWAWAR